MSNKKAKGESPARASKIYGVVYRELAPSIGEVAASAHASRLTTLIEYELLKPFMQSLVDVLIGCGQADVRRVCAEMGLSSVHVSAKLGYLERTTTLICSDGDNWRKTYCLANWEHFDGHPLYRAMESASSVEAASAPVLDNNYADELERIESLVNKQERQEKIQDFWNKLDRAFTK